MVNQNNRNILNQSENSDDKPKSPLVKDIGDLSPTRQPSLKPELSNVDELITSLSSAYENKRARQVFEWERLGRNNVRTTA